MGTGNCAGQTEGTEQLVAPQSSLTAEGQGYLELGLRKGGDAICCRQGGNSGEALQGPHASINGIQSLSTVCCNSERQEQARAGGS